jgi:hypothetical protein
MAEENIPVLVAISKKTQQMLEQVRKLFYPRATSDDEVIRLLIKGRDIELLEEDEREAIEVHKYYLSEKAGYDVGWKFAYDGWMKNYSKEWRRKKKKPKE